MIKNVGYKDSELKQGKRISIREKEWSKRFLFPINLFLLSCLFFLNFLVHLTAMKKIFFLLLAAFAGLHALSQVNPGWLRYSAISPDGKTVVFTYKGDLYRVASSGGNATALTMHEAHDFMPVWSHDGKSIALQVTVTATSTYL
jgi:Tol biopolymer transport system component